VGEIRIRHRLASAVASAVLRPQGLGWAVQPYAVVGAGVHRLAAHVEATGVALPSDLGGDAITRPGFGAGVGMEMPLGRATAFAQARYDRIGYPSDPGLRVVPISLGLRF
jgi:hypothetical protein